MDPDPKPDSRHLHYWNHRSGFLGQASRPLKEKGKCIPHDRLCRITFLYSPAFECQVLPLSESSLLGKYFTDTAAGRCQTNKRKETTL